MTQKIKEKTQWKDFFNKFSYGLSCEYTKNAKKIFFKYHEKGTIKRSKFRISIEVNDKLLQGYLYYSPRLSEQEAWINWLKERTRDTYEAIEHIKIHRIITQPELERKFEGMIPKILTLFGNHNFMISRHWLGSGKPIIYTTDSVPLAELTQYIDEKLPDFTHGKMADAVKRGYKYQKEVFEVISAHLKESHYNIMTCEQEKYFNVDGHQIRFDIFGVVRIPAFNTPMFFVVEVKDYAITYKHISHLLLLDYKAKKVFGNTPVMKFIVCKGANPTEMFKRAYELGISILTAYNRRNTNELVIYPKRRLRK